jgi:hypothetical protein
VETEWAERRGDGEMEGSSSRSSERLEWTDPKNLSTRASLADSDLSWLRRLHSHFVDSATARQAKMMEKGIVTSLSFLEAALIAKAARPSCLSAAAKNSLSVHSSFS